MQHTVKFSWKWFLAGIAATVIAYLSLDPLIIFYTLDHPIGPQPLLEAFTHLADLIHAFAVSIYLIFSIRWVAKYPLGPHSQRLLFMANSIGITWYVVQNLKTVFSRHWPNTWTNDNLSLIRDGAYGFNWFAGGDMFASFPSGHTATAVAFAIGIWYAYPRWRYLGACVPFMVVFGLIGRQYHFVGDMLGGSLVAYAVSMVAWSRCPPPPLR